MSRCRAPSAWASAGAVEKPLDEPAVYRRVPVVLADDPLDDHALPVDQEALGHAGGLIDLLHPAGRVVQDVEGEAQLRREVADFRGVTLVYAHRRDPEASR